MKSKQVREVQRFGVISDTFTTRKTCLCMLCVWNMKSEAVSNQRQPCMITEHDRNVRQIITHKLQRVDMYCMEIL